MVPASLSLLLAAVPAERRARALGTWSAVGALGAALGPVIGGSLVQFNWRWVFWINLPVGLVALALTPRVIPDSRDTGETHRPDVLGAALIATSIGLLALALVKAPSWGWGSAAFLALLAASAAGLAGVWGRSRRHRAPVIELELLSLRGFSGAFVASLLYYAAFGAWLLALVEFLTGVWHYSPVRAGLAIAPGPLTVLPFARLVAPRLGARLRAPGRVAAIGVLCNLASQAYWLTHLGAHSAYATQLLPAQLLGGAGVGLVIPSLLGAGTAALPAARFGVGSGVLNMARQIGTVIGVAALIGVLGPGSSDPVTSFRHATVLVGAFFLAAFATAAWRLGPPPAVPVVEPAVAPVVEPAPVVVP
jgi:MFS transporter